MKTYTLLSNFGNETVRCESLDDAIREAVAMEVRVQDPMGICVKDCDGKTVARIVDGEDIVQLIVSWGLADQLPPGWTCPAVSS